MYLPSSVSVLSRNGRTRSVIFFLKEGAFEALTVTSPVYIPGGVSGGIEKKSHTCFATLLYTVEVSL